VNEARGGAATALGGWLVAWLVGNVLGGVAFALAGQSGRTADAPIWVFGLVAICLWAPMLGALAILGRQSSAGALAAHYGLSFRPVDVIGVPIGLAAQFMLLPIVYAPLRAAWPDAFDNDALQRTARDLVDGAGGLWFVVLAVFVALGAPLVEELVYRGLLQRSLAGWLGGVGGWLAGSALFALIHFRPVEYPGLLVAGLVFGAGLWRTGRLGMGVIAHVTFNAAGLLTAL
jgi:uncharacterized protein